MEPEGGGNTREGKNLSKDEYRAEEVRPMYETRSGQEHFLKDMPPQYRERRSLVEGREGGAPPGAFPERELGPMALTFIWAVIMGLIVMGAVLVGR